MHLIASRTQNLSGSAGTAIALVDGEDLDYKVAIGIAVGLGGAAMLMRLMSSVLFGVRPVDALTYAGVSLSLFAASALSLIMLATTAGVQPSAVASAAGTPTPHWSDPAQGPHARDEARHLQDHLRFSPARTAIQPRAARVAG